MRPNYPAIHQTLTADFAASKRAHRQSRMHTADGHLSDEWLDLQTASIYMAEGAVDSALEYFERAFRMARLKTGPLILRSPRPFCVDRGYFS